MLSRFEVKATLIRRIECGLDAYNNPKYEDGEPEEIYVLAHPDSAVELEVSRPEGTYNLWVFYLRNNIEGSLKGATIQFGGMEYRVVGDPEAYPVCPTDYNRVVKTERVDG